MSQVIVNYNGEVTEFGITRITREKLYGKKRRVVVDDDGEECVLAYLTRDGAALLPSGTTAYMYVTPEAEVVDRKELQALQSDGTPVEKVDSTLGVPQEVTEPVDISRILEHLVTAVYELSADELGPNLVSALDEGKVFEIRFNYRAGFEDWPAFILKNQDGNYFCLVCDEANFEFFYPETELPEEAEGEEEDPFADDLDFSMF